MTDKQERVDALKPCPFCGGGVERVMPPSSDLSEYIRHITPTECPMEFTAFTLDEDLSAAWNARAALEPTKA